MKKRTMAICAGIIALNLTITLSACGSKDSEKEAPKQQETQHEQEIEDTAKENKGEDKGAKAAGLEYTMTAVYLTDKEGDSLFVEIETEMPFYSTIPEGELYNEEGKKISAEDLKNGDVLEITGNGIIAESYPAQYHGVFKMQRTEKENKEYVDKYQSLLEQFTFKQDPKELPYFDVTYRQPEAIVTASVTTTGGCTWSYEKENGETETITVDCAHILQWENIDEMNISEATDMEFLFSRKPEKVEVTEFSILDRMENRQASPVPEGAKVTEIKETQEGNFQITAKPDHIYLVTAFWDNGEVQYGFCTPQIQ